MRNDPGVHVDQAARFVAETSNLNPQFGIVLGTGSGIVAADIEVTNEFAYDRIPNFPVSTAIGHKGRLLLGTLEGHPVLAMDGRFHLYEGHSVDMATMGIRLMHRLGVKFLTITNAAGGLNPQFDSGDVMIFDSHIDLMFKSSFHSSVSAVIQRPAMRTDVYDSELIQLAFSCARANDFAIHQGTYASLLGPNYETRAEYRMLRRMGADVAGMSTVPEVSVAAKLGIRVLALSVVTNVASPDVLQATSGQEVVAAGENAADKINKIVRQIAKTATKNNGSA